MISHLTHGKLRIAGSPDNPSETFWDGVQVALTISEHKAILHLVRNAGVNQSYRQVYDSVRGPGFCAGQGSRGFQDNVRSLIRRARKKFIVVDPTFAEIHTTHGFGYRWGVACAQTHESSTRIEMPLTRGALVVYAQTSQAYVRQVGLNLSIGEVSMLALLTRSSGYVSYSDLYDAMRDSGCKSERGRGQYRQNVRSAIKRIRKKMKDVSPELKRMIHNYPSFGYRLIEMQ